ncbi:MAG: hypothetical protein K2L51_00445 [Clostridiales bacterium]|nr:hypothetical protein [Clostridiales bacterium]
MYGYVVPVKAELGQADFCLYRAFYCGICKSTGKLYGQWPRFTTNYDMVFLSVLLHDYTKQEVAFANERCICNPRKKTVVRRNELFDKIVAANIILAYHKANDDVLDGGGAKKKAARRMLKKHYRKAAAALPEADAIVTAQYEKLRAYEAQNTAGIDRVADCFAALLEKLGLLLTGSTDENLGKLLYSVGKFVYLADALDDIDEDFRKKRYNPLLAAYGGYTNRKQFIEDNKSDLTFLLASAVNRAIAYFNEMTFTGASDLLRNIVYKGLRSKCEQLLASAKKLPPPKI